MNSTAYKPVSSSRPSRGKSRALGQYRCPPRRWHTGLSGYIGSLNDLEARAAEVIPKGAFAFISSGADNQVTLRQNRKALDRIQLLPHYLVNKPAPT